MPLRHAPEMYEGAIDLASQLMVLSSMNVAPPQLSTLEERWPFVQVRWRRSKLFWVEPVVGRQRRALPWRPELECQSGTGAWRREG